MRIETVDAGVAVVREGDRAHEFFVLLSGAADVERAGIPLRSLGPGDLFGELALVTYTRRTATVRTTEPSRVLALSEREFRALLDDDRTFGRSVFAAASGRVL